VAGIRTTPWTSFRQRYAGQRLYRPAAGTYLTRGELMPMVKTVSSSSTPGTGSDVIVWYHPIIVEH
jgi:hypothetical protein